jgi:hypothetical protein
LSASIRRFVPWAVLGLIVVLAVTVSAQEESFSVELDGRKTWTMRYGLGDAVGLAASGLAVNQLTLDQTLAVDISGEALSILTVEAHFDDRQPDSLQSLAITLDTDRLDGVLGDFVAQGIGGLTTYGKKMKGLQLEYALGDAVVTGVASKLEGVSESRTFVGQKAHEDELFSATSGGDPPQARPYKRHIEGLFAYPLTVFYVEEFSELRLSFDVSEALRSVLFQYGLDYLFDTLSEEPSSELEEWEFAVIGEQEQVLLLSEDAIDLVRDRLEATIDRHNDANDLSGDEAKEYPFSRGTAYELGFLTDVATHVRVDVNDEEHPILEAVRRRFYDLGREGVVGESVAVEVSSDGLAFRSISDPEYSDYAIEVFGDAGVLEVDFPAEFFTAESAIRVGFDYTVSGGVFMLGLSIIPGSDRVSVNDGSLVRDVDYMIDYEIGMLVLLVEVQETDVIRVDYERFSGGPFGGADYAAYFYGLTVDWPISEHATIQASLLQSAEDPGSVVDPAAVRTMPNRHTVAGVSGTVSSEGFTADFLVAYSNDQFPFDDNLRVNRSSEVTSITATEEYVFFGHGSGLTVKRGAEWTTYGTRHGLAGRSVLALVSGSGRLFIGTNSGLSVVLLDGLSPLDRVGNWTNYYESEDEGLPNGSVNAIFVDGELLWIGTDEGLVSVRVEEIDDPAGWTRFDDVELGVVTALGGDGEALFVGTEDGVYQFSGTGGPWARLQGSEGARVHDLTLVDGTLYVASSKGLRSYRDGIGAGWLLLGEAVYAVEVVQGALFYGTEAGLVNAADRGVRPSDSPVTALETVGDRLWVGSRAGDDYELTIWEFGEALVTYGPGITGIDGRDPFAYADAEEHTIEGFIERASFQHSAEGFSMSGSFVNLSPSYRSIGSLNRSDSTGWDLAASWEFGDEADLSVSHRYDIEDRLSGAPRSAMTSDLSFQWAFGPVMTVSAQQQSSNDEPDREGPESTSYSYQFGLRDRLFVDRLDLAISWSDGYTSRLGSFRRDTRLSLDADATILPSWTVHMDWGRPVRSGEEGWSGSESLTMRTDWSGTVGTAADFEADYTLGWGRPVPGGRGRRNHELELDVEAVEFELSGWQITPGATFGAESDESSLDLDGRLTARGRYGDLSLQGSLQGAVGGLGERVVKETEKFSVRAMHSGIGQLRPSLSYSVDRQVTIYETQRKRTVGHSLTGRLTWTPEAIHHDELSFTVTSKGASESKLITARIENLYQLDLRQWIGGWWMRDEDGSGYPTLDVRVQTNVSFRRTAESSDLDTTMDARLNAALSSTWSGTLGVSYMGGTDSVGARYGSLLLELSVAIDF